MKQFFTNRTFLFLLLGLLLAFGMPKATYAQTSLATGDLIFTSFETVPASGTPDTFSFVLLTPISSNTTIYFTERGWNGTTWQASGVTEGTISWVSSTALPIGTEVTIQGLGNQAARVNGNANGTVSQVAGGNATSGLSISNAGDQIIAFQGGAGDPTAGGVTRIAGLHFSNCSGTSDAGWDPVSCASGPNGSTMPPGLTGGTSAFWSGAFQTQGKFNGTGTPYSTVAALRTAVMNRNNWVFSNDQFNAVIDVPGGYTYYSTCTAPSVTGNPPNRTICNSGNTTFPVTATGTGLTYQWQVNTGGGFNNVSNTAPYSNATTATLTVTNATASMSTYTYRCVVTGTCGTATSNSATLTVDLITLTPSQVNVACNGATTGSATVVASGGFTPYTYSWSPSGGTAATASGLAAGSYTVTVTDNLTCQATQNFTITQPAAFTIGTSQTNVACNGASTGSATVNVSGATAPYTYSWSPSGGTAASATGLGAGSYTVTITDANLCQTTRNFTITQPAAFTIGTSQTNVACNGASTGSATVNVSGATAPYTYSWSPSGGTAASATGLGAGSYTVTITDGNLCQTTRNFTITQPAAFTVGTSQTNVACNGASTGSATVNVSGATAPYTYSWSPSGGTAASATGLGAGSYTVTITDGNLCQTTRNFTITQPAAFTVGTSQTNVACNGASTGSATVNVSGATAPYTYSWSPSGGTAASATGLGVGSYTVTITDGNLCQTTRNFTITQPPAFSITTSQTNVACNGASTGSATVNVSGATAPYTYSWSPSGGTAASATGLGAGSYTVTITDGNLCQTTRNFTITQPAAFTVGTSQTNVACNGASTGSATVNVSGATAPYTYSWSPSGGTAATASGLAVGSYTVTITDGNLCQTTRNFTITQPPAFSITTSQTNVACNGASTGSATVNVSGATGPYTYSWSPSGGTAATASGLTAGSYTVTITDGNLCQTTRNFTITQPAAFTVGTSQTNVACNGASTGSATVNVSGATAPYTYSWSPSGGTAASATGLGAGSYTVTITDGNLCQTTRNFTLTQPATAIQVTASADTSICAGATAGISAVATGGTTPYSYMWTPGSLSGAAQTVSPDTTTRFIVTATDNAGCFKRDTVFVFVGANLAQAGVTNSNSTAGTATSNNTQTESGVQSYYTGNCALIASVDPVGALGTVTATVTVQPTLPVFQGRPYVSRWYEITPQNNGAANVTLYFTQADFNQYNAYASANSFPLLPQNPTDQAGIDTMVITKMSGGNLNTGQATLIHPDTVIWDADMNYWAVSFEVTSFSQFYVHANNAGGTPLPVDMSSFTATRDQNRAILTWTTTQERNNDGFTIERSTDGKQFDRIGSVKSKAANGNSSTSLTYQHTDQAPVYGLNFYRLVQYDKDGRSNYSAVRTLRFEKDNTFTIYPNPAEDVLTLSYFAAQDEEFQVVITDIVSKVVHQEKISVQKGLNKHAIRLAGLPQGIYHLVVSNTKGISFQTKVIKK